MKNVLRSTGRITAAGKYLVAFADSTAELNGRDDATSTQRCLAIHYKKLHILYLLHDTFHHARHHARGLQQYKILQAELKDCLQALVSVSSHSDANIHSQHHRRLLDLLQLWEDERYWDKSFIQQLRDAANCRSLSGQSPSHKILEGDRLSEDRKSPPYIMPNSHGDSLTPFYDLPAGNMMAHIIPNSTNPINPQSVKPLQFATGKADSDLITSVKALLGEIDSMDLLTSEATEGIIIDTDELGQSLIRDTYTEEIMRAEGYYGWSRGFCRKMKNGENLLTTSRKTPKDVSLEGGHEPRKRQRRKYSQSNTSRSRSSSGLRARSLSSGRYGGLRSQSHSRSSSQSYSPPPPPMSPVHDRSPAPQATSGTQRRSPPCDPRRLPPISQRLPIPSSAPSFLPPSFSPAIPPRPPNYEGPWPPPPPPYSSKAL